MERDEKRRNRNCETSPSQIPCLRWLELPDDVMSSILLRLGAVEIIENAQKVCTKWRKICKDPSMWKSINIKNLGDLEEGDYFEEICRLAIDRSCGGVVDITMERFGTDEFLYDMAQRASKLKRLRIIECWDISYEGLSKAAPKMALLEELEIVSTTVGEDGIPAVGRCCPLLKTFKFNEAEEIIETFEMRDDEALQIAKNMPGLVHLQLIGNMLTNEGLEAILDGCPNLESLDLRRCFFVHLDQGDVGRRCCQQIKNLRGPYESVRDVYGFSYVDEDPSFHNLVYSTEFDPVP